ncbi:hypothetical protein Bca4012_091696 [Brassica carinata]
MQILSRLPGKSVVRFRCVSKLWSSVTSTPRFIKSFTVHSLARPSLLLVEKKEDKRVFCSLPHRQDPDRPYTKVEKYEMMIPKQDPEIVHGRVLSSIRGLICNHDPRREQLRVFTLGDQESWRVTEFPPPPLRYRDSEERIIGGICLNGILYYYIKGYIGTLESFDVRSEKFKKIQMPKGVFGQVEYRWGPVLTSYEGRLAWLCSNGRRWVLTDAEKQEWSEGRYSFSHLSELPRMDGPYDNSFLRHGGVTDNEEVVYMEQPRRRPFYAFYRDMKKNTTRWVAYEELTDCASNCDCFPNHIDNLMPLADLSFL